MDLSTTYMGLSLRNPLVAGASPLSDNLDTVRRLEDAGAAAIVLRSLFEEQISREQVASFVHTERHGESFAEAMTYFPSQEKFLFGPEEYLSHLGRVKRSVGIPVIASLNGTTPGGWLRYATLMEEAGADGLELNLYHLALDPEVSGSDLERADLEIVEELRKAVSIPLAVKVSPFYSSFAHFARRLDEAGADGLVIFNRFYQPDIEPEELRLVRSLHLSSPAELALRFRWLGALSGRVRASLGVTGGIHTALDAVKAVMAGAHAIQMVSALIEKGPAYLRLMREDMARWMTEHEWTSLEEMRGNMSLLRCPDPEVYERANYMLILQGWGRDADYFL